MVTIEAFKSNDPSNEGFFFQVEVKEDGETILDAYFRRKPDMMAVLQALEKKLGVKYTWV